jgi:hypothetical protein
MYAVQHSPATGSTIAIETANLGNICRPEATAVRSISPEGEFRVRCFHALSSNRMLTSALDGQGGVMRSEPALCPET